MTVILGIIAVYMLTMLYIGYRAKKSVKSSADYFIGGSRFGAVLTAIAHQAAGLSGWLFIAWPQQVAGSGMGAIWTAFSSGFAPFINFFVMAKRVARFTLMTGARSFIDLIEARYYDEDRKVLRAVSTVIIAISITVYMSSQLMAAGTTFQAVLVGLFVAFGNGGFNSLMDQVAAVDPALTSAWINPITIVGLLSAGWLGYMGQPQIVQMFMGMKEPRSAGKGAAIAGVTGVFLLFGTFVVNLWCLTIFPGSENTSTNYIQMIAQYTPRFLVGIVTAAILAAVMSSADALLHVATTAVTQDFYNKILKKGQATDRQVLLVARISSVVIGIFAIYIAFNPFDSILWVNWWAWGGLSVFAPILILGFYWKRATREGALVSMIVGFVAVYAWYQAGLNTTLHYTFVAFTVTAVVLVVVSLMTKEPPARIQEMVTQLNRKDSEPEKEEAACRTSM